MGVNNSPNMNLPVPQVGIEAGPQYATDINSCLTLVDAHDHSPGNGVQISPTGININADLPYNSNNLTLVRSVRFSSQSSPLSGPSDLGCLYESGVDLYYNDGNGNHVRITQSGGVAGTPGSISNLTSPASAAYVSANSTFVWESDASTPANLDAASITLRNLTVNSKGLTLAPPNAMASDFSITLPSLPASNLPVSISSFGVMSAATISSGQLDANLQRRVNNTPTMTILTSGSGNYSPPANCTYIKVRAIGGGGGGAGSSVNTAPGTGGDGGNTTLGGTLIVANGGKGGSGISNGGDGGTASFTAPAIGAAFKGGQGGPATGLGISGSGGGTGRGGDGASTPFGGAGSGGYGFGESGSGSSGAGAGGAAMANTGAGGGGGGISTTGVSAASGNGGGGGGYVDVIVPSPSGPYAYVIGTAGTAGGAGAAGTAGGAGAAGIIIIEEHYGS